LYSPDSLQHVLDRALSKRELVWIAGAQDDISIGPVLRIEERIAPDRDPRIGFAISPSCMARGIRIFSTYAPGPGAAAVAFWYN
jgi:hypothetical protein